MNRKGWLLLVVLGMLAWTGGKLLSQDFLVNDAPPPSYTEQEAPEVAVLDSEQVVIWRELRPGYRQSVVLRGRLFHFDGSPSSEVFSLPLIGTDDVRYSVAAVSKGRFAVIWADGRWNLGLRMYRGDHVLWDKGLASLWDSEGVECVDIAADSSGQIVAAWVCHGKTRDFIVWKTVDSSGTTLSGLDTLDCVPRAGAARVGVAATSSGEFAILWTRFDTLMVRLYDSTDQVRASIVLPTFSWEPGGEWADIAYSHDGRLALVWKRRQRDGAERILGRLYREDGELLKYTFEIRPTAYVPLSNLRAAFTRRGDLGVVWVERGADGNRVSCRVVDGSGRLVYGPACTLMSSLVSLDNLSLAAGTEFTTAWSICGHLYSRRFNADQRATGPVADLSDSCSATVNLFPRIVANRDGRFLVVWLQKAGSKNVLKAQPFVRAQQKLGGELIIADSLQAYGPPGVATNRRNVTLIAWLDSEHRLCARVLDSLYQPIGDPFRVDVSSPLDAIPAVAADSAGHFLLAWSSWKRNKLRVHVQFLDTDGVPLDTAWTVWEGFLFDHDRPSWNKIACAWAGENRFLVTWGHRNETLATVVSLLEHSSTPAVSLRGMARATAVGSVAACSATPLGALVGWTEIESGWPLDWDWREQNMPFSVLPYARLVRADGTLRNPEFHLTQLEVGYWNPYSRLISPLDVDQVDPNCSVAVWTLSSGDVVGRLFYTQGGWTEVIARISTVSSTALPGWVDADAQNGTVYVTWCDVRYNGRTPNIYARVMDVGAFWHPFAVEEQSPRAPVAFALRPCHPNPFNASTVVSYELPTSSRVEVLVCDLRGRAVRRLVSADVPSGLHTTRWDGTDDAGRPLPSGVYLVRLQAAGQTAVQKVVLVR